MRQEPEHSESHLGVGQSLAGQGLALGAAQGSATPDLKTSLLVEHVVNALYSHLEVHLQHPSRTEELGRVDGISRAFARGAHHPGADLTVQIAHSGKQYNVPGKELRDLRLFASHIYSSPLL